MKSFFTLLLCTLFLIPSQAQVKRYVTLEHFTNSVCPTCASRNPGFYNLLAQHPGDVHHIAIHPSFPYNTCVFYQANVNDNTVMVNFYNISSTPRVSLNGSLVPSGATLLPSSTLESALNQTSNLYLQVIESGVGANRSVQVKARTEGTLPSGNLRLFVCVLEKTVNQTTPNGESVHYDVLRDLISGEEGDPYTPAAIGQTKTFNYNYTVSGNWNANEVYVLAFVRNADTGEILNSGTKYDPTVSASTEPAAFAEVLLAPNPAHESSVLSLPSGTRVLSVEMRSVDGRTQSSSFTQTGGAVQLDFPNALPGIYTVRVSTDKGMLNRRLVVVE